jgi:phage antirepressor YoqD-like protein/phage anti-repressor protein
MTTDLIEMKSVKMGGQDVFCIDAREAYLRFGIGRDFSTWMQSRIIKHNYTENIDYVVFQSSGENPLGGRPTKEYLLTTETALKIANAEGTPGAIVFREKLIAELVAKRQIPIVPDYEAMFTNPDNIIKMATEWKKDREGRLLAEAQVATLEAKIEADAPMLIVAESVCDSDTLLEMAELAAAMQRFGFITGHRRFMRALRSYHFLISKKGARYNLPAQRALEKELLYEVAVPRLNSDGQKIRDRQGKPKIDMVSKGTAKAISYFVDFFTKHPCKDCYHKSGPKPGERTNGLKLIK